MSKPKKVSFELITRDSVTGHPMYALLEELVESHHEELRFAKLALAWCTSWKTDADGNITLGKCVKASDLHRELAPYDFVILLARWYWRDERTPDVERRRLLDHELCHAAVKADKHGEPMEDVRGRKVYRTRRHDFEEFVEIVERYGLETTTCGKAIAEAIRLHPPEFKGCARCAEQPGWVTTEDLVGRRRAKRCACWIEFQQIRTEIPA